VSDLLKRDQKVLWHPTTQMKDHEKYPLISIHRGEGVWLIDHQGKKYLDAISSWWVNLFGHAHPKINAAIKAQVDSLEHVIFSGFTHEPGIELAERLVDITPNGLSRVFYSDNGSTSVEIALKMSFHYWRNCGKPQKQKFIALTGGYHGETAGALSVGDVPLFKETYAPLLHETIFAPSPDCYYRQEGESWHDYSLKQFAYMEELLSKHAHEVSAVIVEPLVQGANNMRMYHPIYLTKLRGACDKYQVHLIADEVAVGFGRTGTMFACEQAKITPDFICLSKGLTGGYMAMAATLTTENIYQAFYDDFETMKAFLHSHSFAGNPIGCSTALATLDLFDSDNVLEENKKLISAMQKATERFKDHPHVGEVRQTGMMLAIEMVKDKKTKEPYPWQERRGFHVYQYALTQGALLRPIGNVIYFIPPYVITEEQIYWLAEIAWRGIELVTKN